MPYASAEQHRAYQREWVARRRAEYLADKRCVDCGATERLELDHRDPTQKFSHKIWSWNWQRLLAEAAKCDVRCCTCHMRRHEKFKTPKCGTRRAYEAGCRCSHCKAANAAHAARRRARRATTEG